MDCESHRAINQIRRARTTIDVTPLHMVEPFVYATSGSIRIHIYLRPSHLLPKRRMTLNVHLNEIGEPKRSKTKQLKTAHVRSRRAKRNLVLLTSVCRNIYICLRCAHPAPPNSYPAQLSSSQRNKNIRTKQTFKRAPTVDLRTFRLKKKNKSGLVDLVGAVN